MRLLPIGSILIITLLVACACGETVAPQDSQLPPLTGRDLDAAFQTDSLNYHLRTKILDRGPEATIAVQYTNTTEWPVWISLCEESLESEPIYWLEVPRADGNGWDTEYMPRACGGSASHITVQIRETYTDTFTIWNCPLVEPRLCYPRFRSDTIKGDYRFAFIVTAFDSIRMHRLPVAQTVSNVFRLHMSR